MKRVRDLASSRGSALPAALVVLALFAPSAAPAQPAALPEPAALGAPERLTPSGLAAHRPRFSPDGTRVVFYAGPEGEGDLYVIGVDGSQLTRLTRAAGDERDPAFARDGRTIVYSANPDGDYDLFALGLDGASNRLTDAAGDELEPAPSAIAFSFSAVGDDGCGPALDLELESYDKLLYTHRTEAGSSVRFLGWGPELAGSHAGQVSPEGMSCDQPFWAGNGLAAAFRCGQEGGSALFHSDARYDASVGAALTVLQTLESGHEGCNSDWGELGWLEDECLRALPRRYATYPPTLVAGPDRGLGSPAYSANQVVLLASGAGESVQARLRNDGAWQMLPLPGLHPTDAVWAPGGRQLVVGSDHEGEPALYRVATDFYLQEVVDLVDYPELVASPSSRLHDHHFVARAGEGKEFFAVYDQIAYARRAVFITADAVLQAFNDEFTRLLRDAESDAESALHLFSGVMLHHALARYSESGDPMDRFLAAYLAVPTALLGAGRAMAATPAEYSDWDCAVAAREAELTEEDQAWFERACAPVLNPPPVPALLAQHVPAAVDELPEEIREDARALLDKVLAHAGLEELTYPDGTTVPVDFTQFVVRGDYDDRERADYFLTVMWYGQVPLPLGPTLVDFIGELGEVPAEGVRGVGTLSAYQVWARVDALIGSFMGQPVQVSVNHVRALRDEAPELLAPFAAIEVSAWLQARLGDVSVRGLEGALGGEPAPVRFSFLPRRQGLDTTFFSRLTHPGVELRGGPSALDVWASLGVERASEHALASAAGQEWQEAYTAELSAIRAERGEGGGSLAPTDLYTSWLAALRALAQSAAGTESALAFTESDAWEDRLLYSTLAGYAELKHAAVLYAVEEYGVQCGGDLYIFGYVEQPVIPEPRGFVDPVPNFFRALVGLADATYTSLSSGLAPEIWTDSGVSSVRDLAEQLAELAERELAGDTLNEQEYEWIQQAGEILETLFLTYTSDAPGISGDPARAERGVALTVGVYTNVQRGEVLHLGVGRLNDLFVAVPNAIGQRMTQGALFSFYEFWQPMTERLTDAAWNARIEAGDLPPTPAWAGSFLEPRAR